MPRRTAVHLLFLVLLLAQLLAAIAVGQIPASAGDSSTPFSIYSRATHQAAASAAAGGRAAAGLAKPPLWLGQGLQDDSDAPSVSEKLLIPGSRPNQALLQAKATAAAVKPLPRRFIVQLKVPSAAAVLGPPETPLTAAATDADTESTGDSVSTASEPGNTASESAAGIKRSRITPQAAAAAQAVQTQAAAVAAAAGVTAQVTHQYSYALSGFAVQNPSAGQLAAIAADPQVLSVTEDRMVYKATYYTPQFLGLAGSSGAGSRRNLRSRTNTRSNGVWGQLGGVEGYGGAGEDVVIGVIDTGVWMANHSCFADGNYWPGGSSWRQDYKQLQDWKGVCTASQEQKCNDKVLSCRYYTASWGGDDAVKSTWPGDSVSCRDTDGHGSHTASTAAGNYGDTSDAAPSGVIMSGMAPRARIAVYKVLWGDRVEAMVSDLVAAIEDAIKDGVDVINYSVGDNVNWAFRTAVMTAFMNAARAGVFVAAAGGNSRLQGLGVEAINPWVTTVASTTHDRTFAVVTLGNNQQLAGTGTHGSPVGPLPLVYAADIAITDNKTDAALCAPNSLNASALTGPSIVACDRGQYFIIDKANELKRLGAIMLLMNVPGGKTDQFEAIPGVDIRYIHLTAVQRDTVLQYTSAAGSAATATVGADKPLYGLTAPMMSYFSSRGPIPIANAVVLKPDIAAPGSNVFAAYSFKHNYLSGTSMATPHIAGIAALIKDKYPNWSPMAIKSAMMTTAYQTTKTGNTGQSFGTALDYGAGHVDPAKALDPGLVFDSSYADWQRFLCDVEPFPGDDCDTLCPSATSPAPAPAPSPNPKPLWPKPLIWRAGFNGSAGVLPSQPWSVQQHGSDSQQQQQQQADGAEDVILLGPPQATDTVAAAAAAATATAAAADAPIVQQPAAVITPLDSSGDASDFEPHTHQKKPRHWDPKPSPSPKWPKPLFWRPGANRSANGLPSQPLSVQQHGSDSQQQQQQQADGAEDVILLGPPQATDTAAATAAATAIAAADTPGTVQQPAAAIDPSDLSSQVDLTFEPLHQKPPRPGRPKPSPSPKPGDGGGSGGKPPSRPCDAANFNGPWISGRTSVSLTVTRTLTSVLPAKEGRVTFTATGAPDPGSAFDVEVSPVAIKLKGKESQKVTITVKARVGTPLNQYQFGQVVWRSTLGHSVRIPIAVAFSDFIAPEFVQPVLRLPNFESRFRLGADVTTTVTINSLGMMAADVRAVPVEQTESTNLTAPGIGKVDIVVPEGNKYFLVMIFGNDVGAGVDLDLWLYQGEKQIGRSVGETSTEYLEVLTGLPAGTYTAYIYPHKLPAATATAYLHTWMLPTTGGEGPMKVSPTSVKVTAGDMGCCPITLSFSGLDFSGDIPKRYIGALDYSRADGKPPSVPRTMVYIL